jgi:hypothetical protein
MICVSQCDHVGVAGEKPRHGNREIIGFAAAVHEVGDVQPWRHLRSELFR